MLNSLEQFSSFDGRCLLTREEVADLLNEGLEETAFSPNDIRLTVEVCTSFCNNMADFDDIVEATENVVSEFPEIQTR